MILEIRGDGLDGERVPEFPDDEDINSIESE